MGSKRVLAQMILPDFERSSGEVSRRLFLRDARVPQPFSFDLAPRLLGTYDRSEHCPDGRHLWDAILATGPCTYDEDDREHQPFRLTLTCVRCGRIEGLAGIADDDPRWSGGRVPVEPITAGGLCAQQVTHVGASITEWHVFGPGDQRIGYMCTGMTRRGRLFVQGRLDDPGQTVEGSTAIACLRKLATFVVQAG